MISESKNKSMESAVVETKEIEVLQDFFFPDYSITIKAKTLKEAEAKLAEIINKK